jgi:hypothetical protein
MSPPPDSQDQAAPAPGTGQLSAVAGSRYPITSRYHGVETARLTLPDGRIVAYLRRRFLPSPDRFVALEEHLVGQGERVDVMAATFLGDPEQYWRLCDANGAWRPEDLERVGRRVLVTLPEGIPGPPPAGG